MELITQKLSFSSQERRKFILKGFHPHCMQIYEKFVNIIDSPQAPDEPSLKHPELPVWRGPLVLSEHVG